MKYIFHSILQIHVVGRRGISVMQSMMIMILLFLLIMSACESSEEISRNLDHEVPSYKVLTDSLQLQPDQQVEVKVEISDNAGIKQIVFSYNEWLVREYISLVDKDCPKTYTFETSIVVPGDAVKEWEEEMILNDGSVKTVTQKYHKLTLEATDINMNVRSIPIYIHVK